MFWKDPEEASQWQRRALERVTIAIGNLEECAVAVGEGSPSEMAKRILDLGVEVAVVKMGPAGVTAFTRGSEVSAAPVPIEVVNGLGAGDAFGGAVCHGSAGGLGLAGDNRLRQRRRGLRRRSAGLCRRHADGGASTEVDG